MPSSNKVQRFDKYQIKQIGDLFYIVNQDTTGVIAWAKTHEKAVNHILNSTGKYPRCAHKWAENNKCTICSVKRLIKRYKVYHKNMQSCRRNRHIKELNLRKT